MKLFRLMFRAAGRKIVLALILGMVGGASCAALVTIVQRGIGGDRTWATLVLPLCAAVFGAKLSMTHLVVGASYDLVVDIRMRLSRDILRTPLRTVEQIGASRLLTTLTEDVTSIAHAMIDVAAVVSNVPVIVCCLAYLLWLSPKVFALFFLQTTLALGLFAFIYRLASRHLRRARNEQDIAYEQFRAITDGVKELKLNRRRREAFLVDRLKAGAERYRRHGIIATNYFSAAYIWWQDVAIFLLIGLLLFVLPKHLGISQAELSAAVVTILYVVVPMNSTMMTFSKLARANIALSNLDALGFQLKDQEVTTAPTDLEPWSRLELRGVTHVYGHENTQESFTLGPLNVVIQRGEVVFVVGGNGSGKSTLAKLLAGLYTPQGGAVFLDERRIDDENREAYRQLFSAVFSDYYLFEDFVGLDASGIVAQARHYVAQLMLDHKVRIESDGFSTVSLSTGQRKRLALLVTYLEDRAIYVFDEWASDQDPVFKEIFYRQIVPALKARNKTVIVISHDDRYFDTADRVWKLEDGHLSVEQLATAPRSHLPPQ